MKFRILPLIVMISLVGCSRSHTPVSRQSTAMNTYVSITIYDEEIEDDRAQVLIDSAFNEVTRVEGFATDYSDDSEVGRINTAAGLDSVRVSRELIELIKRGIAYGNQSGGKLDITIGNLVKAWDFMGKNPRALTQDEINSLLPHVDFRKIHVNGLYVYLPSSGMRLDLGSYGKGYAIDRAARLLKGAGVKKFIVDIGGNLAGYFEETRLLDSVVVDVHIRHPRKEGEYFGSFKVGTGAVSTSGDYQRSFIEDGIRYHHILDVKTGYPARGVVAVTIVTPDALSGDALSTIVFLLGREKGMEVIRNTPGVEGMIIYEDHDSLRYDISAGLEKRFVLQ